MCGRPAIALKRRSEMTNAMRIKILPFLGLVLLAGGLARGVTSLTGTSTALGAQGFINRAAPTVADPTVNEGAEAAEAGATGSDGTAASSASPRTSGTDDTRLAERYAQARDALDQRARDLDTREKLLAAIESRLDDRAEALARERAALSAFQTAQDDARAEEFENLANAYERMKARDAARIFDTLGDDILVPVAARMRNQALAGVLAEMTPARAQALTRQLALRNTGPAPDITSGAGLAPINLPEPQSTSPSERAAPARQPDLTRPRPSIGPAQ